MITSHQGSKKCNTCRNTEDSFANAPMLTLCKLPNYETMTNWAVGKQEEGVVQLQQQSSPETKFHGHSAAVSIPRVVGKKRPAAAPCNLMA